MNALDVALATLAPPGTAVVEVRELRDAPGMPPRVGVGEHVLLVDGGHFSPRRLRRIARRAGLVVDRELTVLPSLHEPAFVVEDATASLHWFWNNFATVPPGRSSGSLLITLATRAARRPPFLPLVGHLVAGRLMVAHRP